MKLSCLKFSSLTALKAFIDAASPCIIEELDTLICGLFTEEEIELARKQFDAVWLENRSGTWV